MLPNLILKCRIENDLDYNYFASFYIAWNDVSEFCTKSVGADVESGRHIRRLISNWNKIKNKNNSENNPNQYVSESWQLLEQIFSRVSLEKMASIDESEPVSKVEISENNGELSGKSAGRSELTKKDTPRKRTFYTPMDETQRTEILRYVQQNKSTLYRDETMGRPTNESILGWTKVYELALMLNGGKNPCILPKAIK